MVAVIAIGKGGEEEVKAQFSGLSAETIYINPDYSSGANVFEGNFKKITPEHMDFIMNESTTLKGMYLRGSSYKEAVINNIKENISVTGVTEAYSTVSNLKVTQGYDIDKIDVEDGTNVAVIGDGNEALELLSFNIYDLVVLDINIPGVDGFSVLKALRDKDINTRVIIVSANREIEDRINGLDLGANDYLVKPFDFLELIQTIKGVGYLFGGNSDE